MSKAGIPSKEVGLFSLIIREQGYDFINTQTLPNLATGVFRGLWPNNLDSLLTQVKIMTLAVKLCGGKWLFILFFFWSVCRICGSYG